MKREIKFRAWDNINKKWLLGYDYPNLGGFSMKGEVMLFGEYNKMLSSFKLEDFDEIILMQFTGLKDKNGKDIYEGDLVKSHGNGSPVIFENGSFEWNGEPLNYEDGQLVPTTEWAEIIGNIYENPDLLNP